MARLYVHNKDESPRMFESNFLDKFSRVHFTVPLFIFIPVATFFIYKSFFVNGVGIGAFLGLFISGMLIWSMMEYVIHRYIFHYHPSSKLAKRVHFIFHGVHHAYPSDSKRLVMVPAVSIPLAFAYYFGFLPLVGETYIAAFFSGFIIGYLLYDMSHYAVHHLNFKNSYFQKIKKHHLLHHYGDPNAGYGFTSNFWDKVMGTDFDRDTKGKPVI